MAPADHEAELLAGVAERAAARLRDFAEARLMKGAAAHLRDDHDIRLRVGVASAMLMGIIVARCIVHVPTVADESLDAITTTAANGLQAMLAPGAGRPDRP